MDGTRGPGTAPQILRSLLALLHAPGFGPTAYFRLRAAGVDPVALVGRRPDPELGLPSPLAGALAAPDWAAVDLDLAWLAPPGRHLIPHDDPRYPPLLADLPGRPVALFVEGDPGVLSAAQVAVVGSRNPTDGGRRTARAVARELAAAGLCVTSGLASGIDGEAHDGALSAGGATVAVLGTGPDRVYPARHRDLARRVAAGGALVSEFPPGTPPLPSNFPRRNRIVSGLSLGVVVVEASLKSGSLITARLAADQGREVFAVPGSIHNPLARGCHALIREGATLAEGAGDVLAQLCPLLGHLATPPASNAPGAAAVAPHHGLLAHMGFDAVSVDQLVERTGLPAAEVASLLVLLELDGCVSCEPGGRYSRLGGPADAPSAASPNGPRSAQ
ncbi:MAG: DNA-processing protein DprA [Gammaproteobacteria bacterium]|jgi:DNA processing protein|nr:DNA-processing protein DprA [Gammaproteobacteria bacterium]